MPQAAPSWRRQQISGEHGQVVQRTHDAKTHILEIEQADEGFQDIEILGLRDEVS